MRHPALATQQRLVIICQLLDGNPNSGHRKIKDFMDASTRRDDMFPEFPPKGLQTELLAVSMEEAYLLSVPQHMCGAIL